MEPYLKAHTMPAVRAGILKQDVLIDLIKKKFRTYFWKSQYRA